MSEAKFMVIKTYAPLFDPYQHSKVPVVNDKHLQLDIISCEKLPDKFFESLNKLLNHYTK